MHNRTIYDQPVIAFAMMPETTRMRSFCDACYRRYSYLGIRSLASAFRAAGADLSGAEAPLPAEEARENVTRMTAS